MARFVLAVPVCRKLENTRNSALAEPVAHAEQYRHVFFNGLLKERSLSRSAIR
jgi:hypothetical protein